MSYEGYVSEPEERGDRDDDGNYINGELTYKDIAWELQHGQFPPVFSWSDEEGIRMDIAMVYGANQLTPLGEGMDMSNGLLVATRYGMFIFRLLGDDDKLIWKSPSYVAEKLGLVRSNPLGKPLSDLINGVARELLPEYYTESK
jgi:hypothetical protein